MRDKILLFKFYSITDYISLCYCLTKEYKLEKVRLEQEKLPKKVLLDKTASTII